MPAIFRVMRPGPSPATTTPCSTGTASSHWHPGRGGLGQDAPHVHVSAALRPGRASGNAAILPLDKRHLLTGPVSLAGFLGMLVGEFGIAPLAADWRRRLGPPTP